MSGERKPCGRAEDLTGRRFGALTALYRVPDARPTKWHCQCDCGGEADVLASNLKRGYTTSCSACHAHRAALKRGQPEKSFRDLTGMRFGMLTARSYDRVRRKWVCQCDCGGSCYLATTYLTDGSRTDCGCMAAKAAGERIKAGAAGHQSGTNINTIRHIVEGRTRTTNTTGVTGVTARANVRGGVKYRARIIVRGRTIYLGQYDTLEAAAAARKAAEEKYFTPLIEAAKDGKGTK